jgi:hypothetical protein
MLHFDSEQGVLVGPHGSLPVPADDEACYKLAMLVAGECLGLGPVAAAEAFGYSKQRYFQLKNALACQGISGLIDQKTGPKSNHRRTDEAVRQVVRHRFLDREASPEVIAQRLCQAGQPISARSVQRVITYFGLQKKTP